MSELRYLKSHEWAKIDEDGLVVVGISRHAVKQMNKEIVYLELPNVGRSLKQDEVFGTVESVKAASDLYSPVEGVIIKKNDEVETDPALAANDPEGDGWLLKIQPSSDDPLSELLTVEQYTTQCECDTH